ncbi:MAG: (2Fe-2S) ferredoxin domain-containing protein [Polyangiaceae bacterium]
MKTAPFRPAAAHVFVCVNRRREDDPLGGGCAARGDSLYTACRNLIAARGLFSKVWITRSYCLGVCPRVGAAVSVSPSGALFTEVEPSEAPLVIDAALAKKVT